MRGRPPTAVARRSMTTSSEGLTAPFALARFRDASGNTSLGLVSGERIRTLSADELGAPDLNAFLASPSWDRLEDLASREDDGWLPLGSVTLTAPVTPRQVLQTGANYRTHVIDLVAAGASQERFPTKEAAREWAAEMMDERARTGEPYFFIGLPQVVVGDDVELVLPSYSDQHDWELELAVVIGKPAFRVSREEAMDHVAGYTIVNDVTTRDLVFRKDMKEIGTDWYRAKNAPGFLPTGPFLVPARFVGDPGDLRVTLTLNGATMQDESTKDMIFDVATLVAAASHTVPLLPGDLVLTGSPAGNGIHHGRLLRDGDVMEGMITGLGTQRVRAVAP